MTSRQTPELTDLIARPFAHLYDEFAHPLSATYHARSQARSNLNSLRHQDNDWLKYHIGGPSDPAESKHYQEILQKAEEEITAFENGNHTPELEKRLQRHLTMRSVFATIANATSSGLSAAAGTAILNENRPEGLLFLIPAAYFGILTLFEPLFGKYHR